MMPTIEVNGARIYYEEQGSGPETIVFAHGLLWSGHMFHKQIDVFKKWYRCIAFDHRGQGRSEVTASGYDMDSLAEDAAALIRQLDCGPCHFVGLSMGGFVGLRLAIRYPELIRSLLLLDTSADPEPPENQGRYKMLNFIARWFGLGPVASQVMPIMFGQSFLTDAARTAEKAEWRQRLIANDKLGVTRAVNGVISRQGVYEQLSQIKAPTLVIVGEEDVATVPEKSRRIQAAIAGSQLVLIPAAGHMSTIEAPEAVNAALQGFWGSL